MRGGGGIGSEFEWEDEERGGRLGWWSVRRAGVKVVGYWHFWLAVGGCVRLRVCQCRCGRRYHRAAAHDEG